MFMHNTGKDFNIFRHYRNLWFFNFHLYEGNNYQLMDEYFARLMIEEIEQYTPMWDKRIIDVGGATGDYCKILSEERRCDAVNLDPNPKNYIWPNTIVAGAEAIPFDDDEFDIVISRGVLEHIPDQLMQKSVDEMYRVTKPGGICYIVIPPWYNPHAGHDIKPFHVLPFPMAKRLCEIVFKRNVPGNSREELHLYKITHRKMMKMIQASNFRVLDTNDVHFRLHALTKVPLIREILVPAISYICVKVR